MASVLYLYIASGREEREEGIEGGSRVLGAAAGEVPHHT